MHLLLRTPIHHQVNWWRFTVLLSLFPRVFVPDSPLQGIMVARLPSQANGVKGRNVIYSGAELRYPALGVAPKASENYKEDGASRRPDVLPGRKGRQARHAVCTWREAS